MYIFVKRNNFFSVSIIYHYQVSKRKKCPIDNVIRAKQIFLADYQTYLTVCRKICFNACVKVPSLKYKNYLNN